MTEIIVLCVLGLIAVIFVLYGLCVASGRRSRAEEEAEINGMIKEKNNGKKTS